MNWKTILHENLLMLGYPFDSNTCDKEIDLFRFENSKALLDIINFILLRLDPVTHEELNNLLPNSNERKGRIIYLRKLFNWCIGVIQETFNYFNCNPVLFISPKGSQINEFLGRLTTCALKMEIKNFQKNSIPTLHPRVVLSELQSTDKCFTDIITTVNEDFAREFKAHLKHLNTLVTRKEMLEEKLKSQEKHKYELFKKIANLKNELNFNSIVNVDEVYEESIASYDAYISKCLDEVNCRFDTLIRNLEQIANLCDNIHARFVKKPDDVKIDMSSLTINENKSLAGNEEISLERMFAKLKKDLLFNKESYDGFVIRKEENRVKDGIGRIESSLSQNVKEIPQTKQNLIEIENKVVKPHITRTSKRSENFMTPPSFNLFIAQFGDAADDSVDNTSTSDSEENVEEAAIIQKSKDLNNSSKENKRYSNEISGNVKEINVAVERNDDLKGNNHGDLESSEKGDLGIVRKSFENSIGDDTFLPENDIQIAKKESIGTENELTSLKKLPEEIRNNKSIFKTRMYYPKNFVPPISDGTYIKRLRSLYPKNFVPLKHDDPLYNPDVRILRPKSFSGDLSIVRIDNENKNVPTNQINPYIEAINEEARICNVLASCGLINLSDCAHPHQPNDVIRNDSFSDSPPTRYRWKCKCSIL